MKDFLLFKRMLSPIIIQLFFWVVVILFIIGGFQELIIPEHRWKGMQVLLVGPLLARVFCELLLVFFRIEATLDSIKSEKL